MLPSQLPLLVVAVPSRQALTHEQQGHAALEEALRQGCCRKALPFPRLGSSRRPSRYPTQQSLEPWLPTPTCMLPWVPPSPRRSRLASS